MNKFYVHLLNGKGILLIPAFFMILPEGVKAQNTEPSLPGADTLERIVITGQFRPQSADRSIFRIDIIDESEIKSKAANNLGELLKTHPGFQLRSDGILGDFIRIRGLTGEHVRILIDGMPVTGRVADRIDLSQISLQNADRIEIIKGPMSIVYGSNAIAGAINIITRDFENTPLHLGAEGYYESAGTWNFRINGAGKINHHSVRIHGSRDFFGGWGPVDTSRYRTWKPKLQYSGGIGYLYKKGNIKVDLSSDYLDEELRDNGALTLSSLYEKALDAYHYTRRWNNRFNLVFLSHRAVNLQAGYSYYDKRKVTWLNDLVNMEKTLATDPDLHDTTRFHMWSARGFVSGSPGKMLEYQAGFDMNLESASGKRTGGNRSLSDLSGFMNFIISPSEKFRIQPGLRVMMHSDFNAPLIYGLNLDYKLSGLTLKSSYARGFRAPSLKQLYLQFIDNNHEIHGNEDLEPEMADNISVSADYVLFRNKHMIGLETGVFYNNITDAVQLAISTERPGWGMYFNVDQPYRTKGFETAVSYRYSPVLYVNVALVNTARSMLENRRNYFWSSDITVSSGWIIPSTGLQLGLYYKYNDAYLEFAGNYSAEGKLDGITQQSASEFHMLDLTIQKSFWHNRINIATGVKNLFNVTQISATGSIDIHGSLDNNLSAAYGRVFFLSASYEFSPSKRK